jgi:3-oxoacyl-[acyl-carrier protein] reductase
MGNDKIALITGGSKGIGAAIALGLAQEGLNIWLNYRSDHESASTVARQVEQSGRECRLIPFDVSDPESIRAALEPLLEKEVPYALVVARRFICNPGRLFFRDQTGAWRHAS